MSGWDSLSWEAKRGAVLAQALFICEMCGNGDAKDVDHIWPRSLGGGDDRGNLRAACKPCNQAKGSSIYYDDLDRDPDLHWFGIDHFTMRAVTGVGVVANYRVSLAKQRQGIPADAAAARAREVVNGMAGDIASEVRTVIDSFVSRALAAADAAEVQS